MNFQQWFIFFLILQVIHFLGTWKLYVKAGRKSWEAIVPIYNAVILMQIINRPKWWVILLFIPIINLLMFPVVWVETIRSFGKNSTTDTVLVILTLGLYIYYVNYMLDVNYIENRSLKPRTAAGEWVSSIVFAIVAATLVHTYFMQPYTIPTSSLEKSLLIGDFLFVSKFHYGARVPMTTVAAPMVHDTLPIIHTKSYLFSDDRSKKNTSWLNKLQLPYMRIPGIQKIKQNDIVVFNQPADTLKDMNDFHPDRNYYKPIDKKTNLVKRCVGLPGDSLAIVDGYVYINGKKNVLPDRAKLQFFYEADTDGKQLNANMLRNRYHVREGGRLQNGNYLLNLADDDVEKIKNNPDIKSLVRKVEPKGKGEDVFPRIPGLGWNTDNFGPIYIPKKGATVKLDKKSLPFYKRVIAEYENNDLKVNGDDILINGKKADSYTFKQDYYWMMGDNRQNSLDARYWGYVPFDHVVGKPVFIWLSWNSDGKGIDKIRWERMFTTVGGSGKPVSYFYYFLAAVALIYGFNKFRKFKKERS